MILSGKTRDASLFDDQWRDRVSDGIAGGEVRGPVERMMLMMTVIAARRATEMEA